MDELLPALPGTVHGNAMTFIGNRLHNVSGKMENGGLPDQMSARHRRSQRDGISAAGAGRTDRGSIMRTRTHFGCRARGRDRRSASARHAGGPSRTGSDASLGEGRAVPGAGRRAVRASRRTARCTSSAASAQTAKPAPAMVYECDPGRTSGRRRSRSRSPVHHQAQTVLNGKIYVFGGCERPLTGPGVGGWAPVDNAWEFDPVADTYKALAPMPGKRCSAIAENVERQDLRHRRRHDDGQHDRRGVQRPGAGARARHEPDARPGDQHVDEQEPDADGPQPRVLGRRATARSTSSAAASATASSRRRATPTWSRNTTRPEDTWGVAKARMMHAAQRRRLGDLQRQDLRVGRRDPERALQRGASVARDAYDPVANRWEILPSLPGAVHGNAVAFIGNRLHTVSGKMEGGGFAGCAWQGHRRSQRDGDARGWHAVGW